MAQSPLGQGHAQGLREAVRLGSHPGRSARIALRAVLVSPRRRRCHPPRWRRSTDPGPSAPAHLVHPTNPAGTSTASASSGPVTPPVYIVGDDGPGCGMIFYVASSPFACGPGAPVSLRGPSKFPGPSAALSVLGTQIRYRWKAAARTGEWETLPVPTAVTG